MLVIVIFSACAALLGALGLVFRSGRGAVLVAGYNQLTPERKARVNRWAMLRAAGAMYLTTSVLCLASGVVAAFGPPWAALTCAAALAAVLVAWSVRISRDPRLRHDHH
jgi:hypothetical protein